MNPPTSPVLAALGAGGVQIAMGPFLVRVRSELPAVGTHIERLYGDFSIRESDEGHFDIGIVGGRGVRRWVRPQSSLVLNGARPFLPLPARLAGPSLEWGLNWCIGRQAHRHIAAHAAVVERGGRVLILSAPSSSGKSTLCAALVSAGWRLFSDEFALVDPDSGHVLPVPRPISLKNAAIELIRRRAPHAVFSPESVDIEGARFVHMRPPGESVRRGGEGGSPAWLIVPRFDRNRPTTLTRLPKARALIHLTDQSFNYNYLGPKGYACLAALVQQADCSELEFNDLDEALAVISQVTAS